MIVQPDPQYVQLVTPPSGHPPPGSVNASGWIEIEVEPPSSMRDSVSFQGTWASLKGRKMETRGPWVMDRGHVDPQDPIFSVKTEIHPVHTVKVLEPAQGRIPSSLLGQWYAISESTTHAPETPSRGPFPPPEFRRNEVLDDKVEMPPAVPNYIPYCTTIELPRNGATATVVGSVLRVHLESGLEDQGRGFEYLHGEFGWEPATCTQCRQDMAAKMQEVYSLIAERDSLPPGPGRVGMEKAVQKARAEAAAIALQGYNQGCGTIADR